MNGRGISPRDLENLRFIQEQLFYAKRALFSATTVREARFLQNKIKYLVAQAKKLEK